MLARCALWIRLFFFLHASLDAHHDPHHETGWDCVHDRIPPTESIRAPQRYLHTGERGAVADDEELPTHSQRRTSHSPIRIFFETSQLSEDLGFNAGKVAYVERILSAARARLEQVIDVVPVQGSLFVARKCGTVWTSGSFAGECAEEARTSCGTQRSIPDAHLDALTVRYDAANSRTYERGTGVPNSDLVLYVTASDEAGVCTDGVALAFADACERDQKDRPVVGFVNFCAEQLNLDRESVATRDVALAVHEIIHVLGMSESSFPFFRDESGAARTARCPEGVVTLGGSCSFQQNLDNTPPADSTGKYLVDARVLAVETGADGAVAKRRLATPAVTEEVQRHFQCESVQGAELEDGGGAGTAVQHWEQRIFLSETMTGSKQSASDSVLSRITLALLADTGWYHVHYDNADELKWGRAQGCSFLQEACPAWGCSEAEAAACDDGEQEQPSSDANTNTDSASGCEDTCTFDRTAVGYCGLDALMDGCTVVVPYANQRCEDPDARAASSCGGQDCAGSFFGPRSACMSTSLTLDGFGGSDAGQTIRSSCYRHRCVSDEELEIETPDGEWHTCSPGKALQAAGFSGAVFCPATSELCGPFVREEVELEALALEKGGSALMPMWAVYLTLAAGVALLSCATAFLIHTKCRQHVDDKDDADAAAGLAFDAAGPLPTFSTPPRPGQAQPSVTLSEHAVDWRQVGSFRAVQSAPDPRAPWLAGAHMQASFRRVTSEGPPLTAFHASHRGDFFQAAAGGSLRAPERSNTAALHASFRGGGPPGAFQHSFRGSAAAMPPRTRPNRSLRAPAPLAPSWQRKGEAETGGGGPASAGSEAPLPFRAVPDPRAAWLGARAGSQSLRANNNIHNHSFRGGGAATQSLRAAAAKESLRGGGMPHESFRVTGFQESFRTSLPGSFVDRGTFRGDFFQESFRVTPFQQGSFRAPAPPPPSSGPQSAGWMGGGGQGGAAGSFRVPAPPMGLADMQA